VRNIISDARLSTATGTAPNITFIGFTTDDRALYNMFAYGMLKTSPNDYIENPSDKYRFGFFVKQGEARAVSFTIPILKKQNDTEVLVFIHRGNTQEKVDEISGAGYHPKRQTLFWEYDTRLGRRWNVDPIFNSSESRYLYFGDNPVVYSDKLGNQKSIKTDLVNGGIGYSGESKGRNKVNAYIKALFTGGKLTECSNNVFEVHYKIKKKSSNGGYSNNNIGSSSSNNNKFTLVARTFIPADKLIVPKYIPSNAYAFGGDNRNCYDAYATKFRTEQKEVIDFNNQNVSILTNIATPTIAYDKKGNQIDKSNPAKAGPDPTSMFYDNNTVVIKMKIDATNKLVMGAPAIDYEFKTTIEKKDDKINFTFYGFKDGFPACEIWLINNSTLQTYLLLNFTSDQTGTTVSDLWPPMENSYFLNGVAKPTASKCYFYNTPNSK
jgi:Protein of unknown function (DUF3238)